MRDALRVSNLNNLKVENADCGDDYERSTSKTGSNCYVLFDNLEVNLINNIHNAEAVVGCVAWLTSFPILDELRKTPTSIIVQKEDFLRPDTGWVSPSDWKLKLRTAYAKVDTLGHRYRLNETLISNLSVCSCEPEIQGIRCVGNHNTDKKPASPRMHHKFMVFCKKGPGWDGESWGESGPAIIPYAVWTGSFNFTYNATRSFENAVYLTDPEIVWAFFREWEYIAALSEPLDWTSVWAFPEWRIGT